MSIFEPSVAHLRETGSLKWTGVSAPGDRPAQGAWVAEMDFGTAPVVAERLKKAIDDGMLGYLPYWLEDATAEALTRFQEARYGWVIEPSWVRTANSVLGALEATISHLTRSGSSVIVPTPAYMPFLTIPGRHNREVIEVPSLHTAGQSCPEAWSLDLAGIKAGLEAGAGLVILCNPWNPTGRSLRTEELVALHDLVSQYDAMVFSDEIHAPLTFADTPTFVSYASLGPHFAAHTVTAVAASKAWNIAGLSAAQVILPDRELREQWDQKASAISRSAVPLGLLGAVTAYESGSDWLEEVLAYIGRNLDLLDEVVAGTAVDYTRPEATYLTWLGMDAYDLDQCPQSLLLRDYSIAANAGETLGAPYCQWVRLNAAMVRPEWERTMDLLAQALKAWPLKG